MRYGFLLGLLAAIGCGGKPASVSGTVTLDGEPLSQGSVSFQPVNSGKMAVGVIQSDGSYSLTTNRDHGLDLGEYAVTVVARERSEADTMGGPPMPGKYIAPPRYSKKETSGLRYEVESGNNTIDIELTSEP